MNLNIRQLQADLGIKADGIRGPVTTSAILSAADAGQLTVKAAKPPISRAPQAFVSPAYEDMAATFGVAGGPSCTGGRVSLPFAFPLAWDDDQRVTIVSCHAKLADAFTGIWNDAAKHYGETEFRRLRLDQFGGCFNFRNMRGGSRLSIHSWGAAWDIDPANNQLKWGRDKATLAKAEYEPFWKIVESYGAISLGRARNYDWMHFQFCTL